MYDQLLLFVPVALLIALAPGPDNLAILALGMSRGRRASLGFGLGCAAGCLNHTALAVLGVSALIAASPLAFSAMQYLGAAYLVWLGWHALRSKGLAAPGNDAHTDEQPGDFATHFRRGLLANAINPKVAVFFLAFLPQFVRPDGASIGLQLGVLGLCFALCAGVVFAGFALFAARCGRFLRQRPRLARGLDQITGLLFIGLGLRLAIGDSMRLH